MKDRKGKGKAIAREEDLEEDHPHQDDVLFQDAQGGDGDDV